MTTPGSPASPPLPSRLALMRLPEPSLCTRRTNCRLRWIDPSLSRKCTMLDGRGQHASMASHACSAGCQMVCCAGFSRSCWFHYASITLPLRFLLSIERRGRGAAGCRRSDEALRHEDDLVKGIDLAALSLLRPGRDARRRVPRQQRASRKAAQWPLRGKISPVRLVDRELPAGACRRASPRRAPRGNRHGQDAAGQRICRLGAGTRGNTSHLSRFESQTK